MWCDDNEHDSEDWIALVGMGELTHVENMTYGLFESMELEVKNSVADIHLSLAK